MPCHLNNTTAPSADFDASAAEAADALRTSAAAEVLPGSGCSLNAAGSGAASPRQNVILVGGFNPSEKYYSVGIIPNIWKNKTCSKPPTSFCW